MPPQGAMDAPAEAWFAARMEQTLWQRRAKEAGLSQSVLARLVGKSPIGVSRGLRGHWKGGVPRYLKAVITAWRLMTPEQRRAWLATLEAEGSEGEAKPDGRLGE